MKIFCIWNILLLMLIKNVEGQFVKVVMENIVSRSSEMIAQIPNYYSYNYSAGVVSSDSIMDGGHDMFDNGNIVQITEVNFKTKLNVTYGKYYSYPTHEFISNASQPFHALTFVYGEDGINNRSYSLNVIGNLGSDGKGKLYRSNGSFTKNNFSLSYSVFQITDKTDATICEVFYKVTNQYLWQSSATDFQFDVRDMSLDSTDNIMVLKGENIKGNLLGYTLLSKYLRSKKSSLRRISKKEIEGVLRIILHQISLDIDECSTNSHRCSLVDSNCVNTVGSYTCVKKERVFNSSDPCGLGPCQNNGTCFINGSTYSCNCLEGYYDDNCTSEFSVVKYNGLNITFYTPLNGATHYEAERKCEIENSELLIIKNSEIQKIVTDYMSKSIISAHDNTSTIRLSYWLGGGNRKKNGPLKWSDNTTIPKSNQQGYSNHLEKNCSNSSLNGELVGVHILAAERSNSSAVNLGKWMTSPKKIRMFGFICQEIKKKDQCNADFIIGFHFNETLINNSRNSKEKCKNGRPAAKVACEKISNETKFGQVNVSTCHFENDTFEAKTEKELTLAVEQLGAVTSIRQKNITQNNTVIISNQIVHISTAVQHNNLSVSSNLLEKVTNTASIISGSFTKLKTDLGKSISESYSIVNALDNLTLEVDLNNVTVLNISTNNIQLQIADVNTKDIIDNVEYKPTFELNKTTPILISVPKEAFKISEKTKNESVRVVFTVFNGSGLYPAEQTPKWVVSAVVGGKNSITNLTKPVEIRHVMETTKYGKMKDRQSNMKVKFVTQTCVYWDDKKNIWSHEGCCLDIDAFPPLCKCDHLTSFSILVSDDEVPADIYLSLVSDIGSTLSAAGFFLSGLILLLHKESRTKIPAQIQVHICLNLFLGNIIFLFGIELVDQHAWCTFITACLQFTMLSGWFWIAVYSNQLYSALVKVFDSSSASIMRTSMLFAYGCPLLIVVISCGITLGYFDHHFENPLICYSKTNHLKSYYRADNFCWLHGYSLYFGFLLWIGLILLYNISVMCRVMLNICNRNRVRSTAREHNTIDHLKMAFVFSICLGLTWITGILFLFCDDVFYNLIISWVFSIFNAFQGAFLFYILCIKKRPVFVFWTSSIRKLFGCKITKTPDTEITNSHSKDSSTSGTTSRAAVLHHVCISNRKSVKNRKSALQRYSTSTT